jgi:hypothetical protein
LARSKGQFPTRSAVSVLEGEAEIADQRSSKFKVGIEPAEATMPSVEGEWDRVVATVAATAIRAIATNPVILLCFVMRTSCGAKPI